MLNNIFIFFEKRSCVECFLCSNPVRININDDVYTYVLKTLALRIFFSNMSNLFKNNMNDVFCQEKRGASSFTDIDTNVQY